MNKTKLTKEERKQQNKERQKQYYQDNKERRLEYFKQYGEENKTQRTEYIKQYHEENPERRKTYYQNNKEELKQYRKDNQNKANARHKQRIQSDQLYKLIHDTRALIGGVFKNQNYSKHSRTSTILGCTWEQFKKHLESQFEPWMNWDNRGGKIVVGPNMTWDLDHIIPVSSAVNEDDIIRLNHYTNFQPLCSFQNRFVKRNKI
jgi:hypothetical protein